MSEKNETLSRLRALGMTASTLLLLLLVAVESRSQSTTFAQLLGTVTDQTGAVVPGAEVTVINRETTVVQKALTNGQGNYVVDKLIPGSYDAAAELPGFKKQLAARIQLMAGQKARVDFLLSPGEISETVTVEGSSVSLDTASADIQSTIGEKAIQDLPLAGRNVMRLGEVTTGAVSIRYSTDSRFERDGGGLPAVNGLTPASNQIQFDGAPSTRLYDQKSALNPTPETVKEFQVITNTYSAEYGRVGGAVVSMVSKSGTNQFHGTGWEYFRNERFDANGFFANRSGLGKLPLSQHDFGGAVGGPIFKGRTFFFGSYERFTDSSAIPGFMTIPSLAERQGDFSKGDGPWGLTPIYDPLNVVDGRRVAFPDNKIPESRLNPIARTVLQRIPWPTPNQASFPNYAYPHSVDGVKNKYSARIDHHFSGGSTLFGRITWQNDPTLTHGNPSAGATGFFVGSGRLGVPGMLHGVYQAKFTNDSGWQTTVGWVKSFGSNMVSELNAAGWRGGRSNQSIDTVNWLKEFGYDLADKVPLLAPDGGRGPAGLPTVSISGYAAIQGEGVNQQGDWGVSFKEALSIRKGNHYLKLGVEHQRNYDVRNRMVVEGSASNSFDGYASGQIVRNASGAITGATFGQPFADFLLGTSSSATGNILGGGGYGTTGGIGQFDQSSYGFFINDDWKLSSDLTLNLGLRWEIPLPEVWEFDKANCYIDVTGGRNNPVQIVPKGFPFDADFVTGGDRSVLVIPFRETDGRRCRPAHYKDIAPRLGLAWRPLGSDRTVVRLGAGVSFDQDTKGNFKVNVGFLGPYAGGVTATQARGQAPSIFIGKFLGLPTIRQSQEHQTSYFRSASESQSGQIYSYSLSLQHKLLTDTKVEVAYVGNQGRHLQNIRPWNVAMPAGQEIVLTTGERFLASGTQAQRRPYPLVRPDIMIQFDGNSSYHSLQAKVDRQVRNGIGISAGWTFGRTFATNFPGAYFSGIQNEYRRSELKTRPRWDRLHSVYGTMVWELPWLRTGGGFGRRLLGGWEVTSLVALATGAPYGVMVGRDVNDIGRRVLLLPDRIAAGQLPESQRTVDRYYDVSAFQVAGVGRFGNSAMFPLEGDGIASLDLGIHKSFSLGEARELDFRVEMFNALNHPIFATPGGTAGQDSIDALTAGKVTVASDPRRLQFALRFSF